MQCPHGTLDGTFEELHAAGCIQTGADSLDDVDMAKVVHGSIFELLRASTNGNICQGCPVMDLRGSKCVAFQKYHSTQKRKPREDGKLTNDEAYGGWTIAEIAAKLNISKNEVRRRRIAGTLDLPRKKGKR